jgi:porin
MVSATTLIADYYAGPARAAFIGLQAGSMGLGSVLFLTLGGAIGNATQTNFEAFYNIPVSKKFRLTPIVQVISNAGNQRNNGTIVTGTLRGVFSF